MANYSRGKVSMQEYLEYMGHEIGKPNSGGFSLIDDHDSFFVNLGNDGFNYFKTQEKGGLFKLMEVLDGITDDEDKKAKLREIRNNRAADYEPKNQIATPERTPFDYSKLDTGRLSEKTQQYLTDVRGLNPVLVNALSESGFLVEQTVSFKNNKISNLLYNWKDSQGKIVGADQQGVVSQRSDDDKHGGYHKAVVKGSPASSHGFNFRVGASHKEIPDKLVVVEAPVDAISYWQMNIKEMKEKDQQVAFVSLSGVKSSVLNNYIKDHYNDGTGFKLPSEIHFATDNDEAGRKFAKDYGQMLEQFETFQSVDLFVDIPGDLQYKDWNDQLRYGKDFSIHSVPFEDIDTLPFYEPELSVGNEDLTMNQDIQDEDISTPEETLTQEFNQDAGTVEMNEVETSHDTNTLKQNEPEQELPENVVWENIPTQEQEVGMSI